MSRTNTYRFQTTKGIEVLRTPEDCFDQIHDYPFQANYCEIEGIRMHYLDENPDKNEVVVLLHGEPTWSYLYRKLIPELTKQGYRVVVPDLIGFGKSDKLVHQKDHSYSKSTRWLKSFLFDILDLRDINIVLHDWGGLIGLRIIAEQPLKFKSVIATNTYFPIQSKVNFTYLVWRWLGPIFQSIFFKRMIALGVKCKLSTQDLNAYAAPFPSLRYKAAPLKFPTLLPIFSWSKELKTNQLLWEKLKQFERPFLTIYSKNDPFTKGAEIAFITEIKGAKHQNHLKINNAGHLIQEDQPELFCQHILVFLKKVLKSNS